MITDAVLSPVWHALADPWSSSIMVRAFAEVGLLGIAGGALGCWIVFYGLSYSAESLAHSLFPGLVLAALLGIPLLVGGAAGIIVAALAVALAARAPGVERDTSVAVVVTGLFGLGALLALSPATPAGLSELLFGDILGLSNTDLVLAGGLAAVVLVALRALHGRLLAVGFDRSSAPGLGVPVARTDAALLVLLALTVLVAVQALGNLLVVAVLVGPAASARLLAHRIVPMMLTAAALTILAGFGGLYLSYYARTAAGASIAGLTVAVYLLAAAASRLPAVRSRPGTLDPGITIAS
jgi:ABC-type Mn2+/Zn2+ transport system permease subunit